MIMVAKGVLVGRITVEIMVMEVGKTINRVEMLVEAVPITEIRVFIVSLLQISHLFEGEIIKALSGSFYLL